MLRGVSCFVIFLSFDRANFNSFCKLQQFHSESGRCTVCIYGTGSEWCRPIGTPGLPDNTGKILGWAGPAYFLMLLSNYC